MLRLTIKHYLTILAVLFLWPQIALAANPPNLLSPADNSAEDSFLKLNWEYSGGCVENGSCFRVEVDNNPDFSSAEKSTYTNNFSYSPQNLPEGLYHWRVRAKDSSGTWSDWSKVLKFTIGTQTGTPSPSSTASNNVQNSPTTQPPDTQKIQNIFSIKDIPSEINSNTEFEVEILLNLPNNPNHKFYLKGAFKKSDSSNYFAETLVGNSWVKNNSSYSSQFKIETDKEGRWEGKIKVRPDPNDSGFDGSGDYVFKTGKYTETGSGPTWSNELNLKINEVAQKPSPSLKPEEEEIENEPDLSASLVKAVPSRNYEISKLNAGAFKIASVAGEATISNNIPLEEGTKVLEEKKINWLLIYLGIAILAGGIGFTLYKARSSSRMRGSN